MQKRHFIVHHSDGVYAMKEVSQQMAEGVTRYGVVMTESYCHNDDDCWFFYFVNTTVHHDHLHDVIATLVQKVATLD